MSNNSHKQFAGSYKTIKRIYLEILELLDRFLLLHDNLEENYYINGARNILSNEVNAYIDYTNFLEIANYFHPLLNEELNILDLGCGLGDKAVILKRLFNFSKIYGVETTSNDDSYHKMYPPYLIFEKVYPMMSNAFDTDLSLYDGYSLNFTNNFFDVILLYAVVEHISPVNRKILIDRISKKIKSGGYVVVTRCPRYYSLTEFIARKFNLGAHQWVLKRQELLSLFDKDLFDVQIFKRLGNVPANPAKIMNKLATMLIYLDKFLNFIKWPFSSDYFLIVKKK